MASTEDNDVEWPSFIDMIDNTNNTTNTNTNHIVKVESDNEETEGGQVQQGHQQTIDEDDSGNRTRTPSVDPNPNNEINITNNTSTNDSTSMIVTPVKEEKNDDQEILISNLRKEKHILSQKVTRYQRKSNQYKQQLEDMKNEKMKLKQDMREQNEIFATEKSELLREIDQLKKMKLKEVESSDGNSNSSSDMRDSDSDEEESSTSDSSSSSSDHSFCDKNSSIPKLITTSSSTKTTTNTSIEHSLALATGKRKKQTCDYNNDVTSTTIMSASSSCRHQNKKKARRQETTTHRRSMNSNNINHLIQSSSSSDQNSLDLPDFKSGKYRRFAECKLFHLLAKKGWKFRFHKNPRGITIRPIFYPPPSENERNRKRLTSDVKVKEYLKEHGMMTPELKRAFDTYDQGEDEEISLASVHDESSNNNNINHHLKPSSFSSSRGNNEMESSHNKNENKLDLPDFKSKYRHFAACKLFHLLHEQGWTFRFHRNYDGSASKPNFFPPKKTSWNDALFSDVQVKKHLENHRMMTPELEKAFDEYDQEVQKEKNEIDSETDEEISLASVHDESSNNNNINHHHLKPSPFSHHENNEMESSHNKNENRFVPSVDIKTGKYRRFLKTGKYKRMADCNIFGLLDKQGWRFEFYKNPKGITYRPAFYPPPNENEKKNPPLRTDDKVKEYLKEHHIMTKELKIAFYVYDQEVQKEKKGVHSETDEEISLASVHDESSNNNNNHYLKPSPFSSSRENNEIEGLREIKTGKYKRMADCNIFHLLAKQGWKFQFQKNIRGNFYKPFFYPPGETVRKDALTTDDKVKKHLEKHGMMTPELKRAFDTYEHGEVQKKKNEIYDEEFSQGEKSSTSSLSSSSSSSSHKNKNRFVPSNIKTGKYTHFEKCNLFVLLDEQGWTFKHYVSSNSFHFYPPGKTQYKDAVTCDIKVREYLIKHHIMTKELEKAFDTYEQEVQKEKNSIDSEIDDEEESSLASVHDESSNLQSSENISSSLSDDEPAIDKMEASEGQNAKTTVFVQPSIKAGKYKHFFKYVFELLHQQGWDYKRYALSNAYYFYPPSSEKEKKNPPLRTDDKVKEYLKEHNMMTPELEKAFDDYEQEVQKEKNEIGSETYDDDDEECSLASVHDESSILLSSENVSSSLPSYEPTIDEMEDSEDQNTKVFVQPYIKVGKYKHFFKHVCELLHQQGWKVYSHVASSTYRFFPPGKTISKDSLKSDIKVREYLNKHHMMTPELKKAFDTYEQEVQKENNEMESSHNKNENNRLDLPDFKSKYRHFAACKLFHLLHEQGWTFRFHRNHDGSASKPNFFPPKKTSWNDALFSDVQVKKHLENHRMMTPELKKAFDEYDQEVQKEKKGVHSETDEEISLASVHDESSNNNNNHYLKPSSFSHHENNEMESSHNKNENRFVPSVDIKTGKYRRFLKTGKYKRMADCNIFVLLDKQGWRFEFYKNPKGITYRPAFYPPPNENEKKKPPLTSDVKVKEYLKEHGMMTEELKIAFYVYDQEEEYSLASVHDESSILQSDNGQTIDNTSYTQEESTLDDHSNFTMPGLHPNEETLFLRASKILRKIGWFCNYKIHSWAVAGEMEFYPDPNQIYVYYRHVGEVIEALSKENSSDNLELIEELDAVLKQYNEKKLAE